jgi:hypothetical protein
MSKKSRLTYSLLLLIMLSIYAYQWFQVIPLPETESSKPDEIQASESISTKKWYEQLIKNNLFDPERGAIIVKEDIKKTQNKQAEKNKVIKKQLKWLLKGIAQTIDGELIAVIQIAAKQKHYRVGEKLPNGEVLEKIMPDGIKILDKDKQNYYLFGKKASRLKP